MVYLTSKNNRLIREILMLQEKAGKRRKSGLFVIEGQREFFLARQGGYRIIKVLGVKEYLRDKFDSLAQEYGENFIRLSKDLYSKVAYRKSTEGIIAIAEQKELKISNLYLSKNPLLLVAENIEKPGNIGAMLRTADAAGIDAFILLEPKTDFFNPNVIRSSVGTVFTVKIATATHQEFEEFIRKNKIKLYAATLQNTNPYYSEDYKQPTAIAVGAEDKGLSEFIRKIAYKQIIIPMYGKIDSMNVSVSAAILIFEAVRQRKLIPNH